MYCKFFETNDRTLVSKKIWYVEQPDPVQANGPERFYGFRDVQTALCRPLGPAAAAAACALYCTLLTKIHRLYVTCNHVLLLYVCFFSGVTNQLYTRAMLEKMHQISKKAQKKLQHEESISCTAGSCKAYILLGHQ
jgi:hypothetical protein